MKCIDYINIWRIRNYKKSDFTFLQKLNKDSIQGELFAPVKECFVLKSFSRAPLLIFHHWSKSKNNTRGTFLWVFDTNLIYNGEFAEKMKINNLNNKN